MSAFFRKPIIKFFAIIFLIAGFLFSQFEARAATSFIGTSNLVATNGSAPSAITPNASTANGDLLVFYHYSRASGGSETVTLPAGFTSVFNSVTLNRGLVAVGWRIKQAGDTTFTATVTNHSSGGAGATIVEWIETFRGTDITSPIVNFTPSLSTWTSSLNVGPISAPTTATVTDGDMVVVFGGRFENITGQTVLSGDNLTWSTRTLNDTTLGSDAAAVTQTGLNASGSDQTVTSKTITTTGTTQAGAGRMFIIKKAPDTTPPTPNPMTFATVPTNDSAVQISMTSSMGSDATPPVNYLFTNNNTNCGANAGTGGASSAWQAGTTYSNSGLQVNKCYGYTVTARDSVSPTPNTGTASGISSTYTSANVPGTPTLSGATTNSLNLTNAENSNPSSNPTTNFAVQVVTTSDAVWLNKWVDASGNPSATAVWMTDAQLDASVLHSLQSSMLYGVKVKARNNDADETALSAEGQGTTSAPAPITTISNFVTGEPSNTIIAPGTSALVDSFGLQTSSGTDTVTGAIVTLASGTGARVATVAITNNLDTLTYCSVAPSGDTATLTSCGIPVNTTNTQFKIKITAISHTAMPIPPGASYAVTGIVNSFTSTNAPAGSDSASATVTIDNLSPAGTTSANAAAGNAQVTVSWTNPADSDFQKVIIYCKTSSITEFPTEGTDPSVDATACDATARVKYSGATSPQIFTGLTNNTTYFFRIFARDTNGNFTATSSTQQVSAVPAVTTFAITASSGANGTVTPTGVTNVAQGSSQIYAITPNSGYDVATLLIDGGGVATSTTYTFTDVQATHTISATFVLLPTPPTTFTIFASAGTHGAISPMGTSTITQGNSQTYTLIPDTGYAVATLTIDGSTTATTTTSYTFSNVQANHIISSTFALIPITHTITSSAGSGGAISPLGAIIVADGASQSFTISHDPGFTFETLVVDGVSIATTTPYVFPNVTTNHTISATFALIPAPPDSFTIVATQNVNGSIVPSGSTIIPRGNSQAYTITPDAGYEVGTLIIDSFSTTTATSYTFTNVQSAHTIEATFTALLRETPVVVAGRRLPSITFSGKAFPGGKVSIVQKELSAELTTNQQDVTAIDGSFRIRFVDVPVGVHSFGLLIKDPEGRTSQTKFFLFDAKNGDEVYKDIVAPPTIDILNGQVSRGSNVKIFGYASPGHTIRVYLNDILAKEALAGRGGVYSFELPTGALDFGQYTVRAKQINLDGGKESDFSTSRTFIVSKLAVVKADWNGDGKIDIKDWSIFLARFASHDKEIRRSVDLNGDGKTDISDFSIFIKTIRKK